jgi:hypothetical protein
MPDDDWGQPEQQTSRGGGGRWLLLLLGFVVLMMFLNSRAQQQGPPEQRDTPRAPAPVDPTQAQRPSARRTGEVQREGDWSLEEIPGRPNPQVPTATTEQASDAANPAPPKKTEQGDWKIEEVPESGQDTSRAENGAADAPREAASPKKSTEGDWTIEEIKQSPPEK